MILRTLAAGIALALPAGLAAAADPVAAGQRLYTEGVGADGLPVLATRAGGLTLRGAAAACVNCHRRSGFGGAEGRSYIPPITAAALGEAKAPGTGASAAGIGRPAYTDRALARAIRAGMDPTGRRLDYLMPRYRLSDEQVRDLIAYLRRLSAQPSPGSDAEAVHFATVLAPGIGPARRQAALDTLRACFDEHNAGPAPERGRKRLGAGMSRPEPRPWRLHAWELVGEPQTWKDQLARHAAGVPVFAVIGGLGGGNWAPVHEFCEQGGVPCLFPRAEAPMASKPGFYALYASRGVLLEAAIIARDLAEAGGGVTGVVQVLRAEDTAANAAAEALAGMLAARGVAQELRAFAGGAIDPAALAAGPGRAVVLWLRGDDLKGLAAAAASPSRLYLSALLADPERTELPAPMKDKALIAYPFALPEERQAAATRLRRWLHARSLPLVDETVQAEAYLACDALGIGMNEIGGHFLRDYLVERIETVVERGVFPGLYPRLALGPGQRFASKTGYLVRFAAPDSSRIVAVGERMAP